MNLHQTRSQVPHRHSDMSKRLFDFLASLFGLLVSSPLLILMAIWVKLDSPGPVFYRAERVGWRERPFRIFKFRSMVANADAIGGHSTADNDPRVTRSGRLIRKLKLDELSQLINVLRGEMSLVGPRPQVSSYVEANYSEAEKVVFSVRPGITDWASIWNSDEGAFLAHFQDPDDAYAQYIHPTKIQLQLYYVENHSLWIDIKIIFYTLYRILRPQWLPGELHAYGTLMDKIPNEEKSRDSDYAQSK